MVLIQGDFIPQAKAVATYSIVPKTLPKSFDHQCWYSLNFEFKIQNYPLRPDMQVSDKLMETPVINLNLMVP